MIEAEDEAATTLQDRDAVTSFVEETNFAESSLILVQNGIRSTSVLELASIRRRENGLRLEVAIDSPVLPDHDDLETHSLLIRITDENAGVPETVTVDIDGYA